MMERSIGFKMAELEPIKGYNQERKQPYLKTSYFEHFETQKLSSPRVFNIFKRGFH